MLDKIKAIKKLERAHTLLTDKDVIKIIKYYKKNYTQYPRHFIVFLIGIYTGMRSDEIRNITVDDIKTGDSFYIYCKTRARVIFIDSTLRKIILQYCGEQNIAGKYLYESTHKRKAPPEEQKPLNRDAFYKDILLVGTETRVDKKTSEFAKCLPHNMRRFFIKKACDVISQNAVKQIVGHKNNDVTDQYARLTVAELHECTKKVVRTIRKAVE